MRVGRYRLTVAAGPLEGDPVHSRSSAGSPITGEGARVAQPEPSRPATSLLGPATAEPSMDARVEPLFRALVANVERVIQGKREAVHLALVCLLAEGHLLIEDVPGVGKTSLAKAIARSIGGTWHRVQFTPDLLPSDVTGVSVWNRHSGEFEFRPGGCSPTSCSPTRSTARRPRRSRRCSRRWKSAR